MQFIRSFQSEWLKIKRSLAWWLVFVGGLFVPSIVFLSRITHIKTIAPQYKSAKFWNILWYQNWEAMSVLLLPVGIILAIGLLTQLEFKNNAWKQLHTTPQSLTTIFFAKLLLLFGMMLILFVWFNTCIYLSGVLPAVFSGVIDYPSAPIPWAAIVKNNAQFFLDCLPVVGLQFLISLQYKNFLVPIGVGFVIWVASVGSMSWEYNYILPYIYCGLDFLKSSGQKYNYHGPVSIQTMAVLYFVVFLVVGYVLYLFKPEKG